MGKYKRRPKAYKVVIEDGEHAGFEMTVRSVQLGKFVKLARLSTEFDVEELKAKGTTTKEASGVFDGMAELFESFGKSLIEWNLQEPVDPDHDEEDDPWQDVPANVDGVMSQEFEFVMFLVGEWIAAMGGIPDPLGKTPNSEDNSNGGDSTATGLADLSQPLSPEQS